MKANRLPDWANLYLQHLQLPVKTPSFSYLSEICTAHLTKIPFENISKLLLYKKGKYIPEPEEFVEQIIHQDLGGTCYAINRTLFLLLQELGFECRFANLGKVHMAILVRVPDCPEEWLYVDCGSAAPFFRPVRFETDPDNVSAFGGDESRIVEEEPGVYAFRRYIDGKPSKTVWTFEPSQTYTLEDFLPAIQQSFQPGKTFMKMLRCQLWQLDRGRSLNLSNHTFTIRTQDGKVEKQKLSSVKEIREVMEEEFGLPKMPVEEAIEVLNGLGVDIFQEES
jgi:N-hydroxyarylamine O-acetyltransferase